MLESYTYFNGTTEPSGTVHKPSFFSNGFRSKTTASYNFPIRLFFGNGSCIPWADNLKKKKYPTSLKAKRNKTDLDLLTHLRIAFL